MSAEARRARGPFHISHHAGAHPAEALTGPMVTTP
jgi:hypothetical protein